MRATPKTLTLFAAVAASLSLAACGNKEESIHGGETEGIYVNVANLKYQVEISRQLNPRAIPEDQTFVQGLSAADAKLAPDELWFAVFVRVENETKQPQKPATGFAITDTEGNTYHPVTLGPTNPFAYSTAPIPGKGVLPGPDTVAYQVQSIGGVELLFKLKRDTLNNRPLLLHIKSYFPDDQATDVLDV